MTVNCAQTIHSELSKFDAKFLKMEQFLGHLEPRKKLNMENDPR